MKNNLREYDCSKQEALRVYRLLLNGFKFSYLSGKNNPDKTGHNILIKVKDNKVQECAIYWDEKEMYKLVIKRYTATKAIRQYIKKNL